VVGDGRLARHQHLFDCRGVEPAVHPRPHRRGLAGEHNPGGVALARLLIHGWYRLARRIDFDVESAAVDD
jgi:hypothetical protein